MIDIKYGILILACILSVQKPYAQIPTVINHKNFFDLKTDYDFQDSKKYEKVSIDSQIIAFRKFHDNEFTIAEEYLHVKNDTFLFREYSSANHLLTSSGKVVPSICCGIIDTTYTFDPETYEEKIVIHQYWNWSKEGLWKTENADFYEYGNYQNNLKIGEWYVWDKSIKSAKYVYFDSVGIQVFEEPENLIQTNNKERIRKEMLGTWRIEDVTTDHVRLIKEKDQKNVGLYGSLIFGDSLVKRILYLRCATGFDFEGFKKRSTSIWTIDDDNVISMPVYGFEHKKLKITYLSRYEMYLTF